MKPIAFPILKYGGILFLLFVIIYLLSFYIPEYISPTKIRTNGLLIVCVSLALLIVAQKDILKFNFSTSITKLTFVGTAIVLIAEAAFQIIRVFSFSENRIYHFLSGVFASVIFFSIISFLIAFQLKTKRTGMLILFTIIFLFVLKGFLYLVPSYPR